MPNIKEQHILMHSKPLIVSCSCRRELFELRAQLTELKTTVELRSLSVPDFDDMNDSSKAGPRRTDTLISINGTDGMGASGGMGSPSCSIPSDDKESLESDASQVFIALPFCMQCDHY